MPLSEDSRALLQLLLGRGKTYSDISELLGIEEAEVRSRATKALAEVDASLPAPDAGLTDYLLGQADPIARADVKSRLSDEPALAEQAADLAAQLQLLVPSAELPGTASTSEAKPKPAAPKPEPAPQASVGTEVVNTSSGITNHQRRLIALLLGGAFLALVVILLVTGVFGGSDDNGDKGQPEPAATVAVLEPASGQQGSGQVQFGFSGTTLAANLQLSDLEPSKKGKGYVLWLYGSTGAFPINASRVGKSGAISGQITLNEAVICLVATDFFPTLRLSRVDNQDFNKALSQASLDNQSEMRLPEYTGQTVLEGPISMPQTAKDAIIPICNGSAQAQQNE